MPKFKDRFATRCATDRMAWVTLTQEQELVPAEGRGTVIFPPTYRDGYNIDTLADGRRVATIDSVGSQGNRMENAFLPAPADEPDNPLAALVPQVTIDCGEDRQVSLLECGHRLADALVRCTELADEAQEGFTRWLRDNDGDALARLAPTTLVFGAWDSRGTQAKVPRLLQSVVRAWDVDEMTRSAQYVPPINYAGMDIFDETEGKASEERQKTVSSRGFGHIPSTGEPGGILVNGRIVRLTSITLIILRRMRGKNTEALRRYILGVALAAATAPLDGFYRQGCMLVPDPDKPAEWHTVGRDGKREPLEISEEEVMEYARRTADEYGVAQPRTVPFDRDRARRDMAGE